jgi:hypothetical protein
MNWLITVGANADLGELSRRLAELGCKGLENLTPVPLGPNEQVIQVSGPEDLPERAKRIPGVRKISPSSEMTFY